MPTLTVILKIVGARGRSAGELVLETEGRLEKYNQTAPSKSTISLPKWHSVGPHNLSVVCRYQRDRHLCVPLNCRGLLRRVTLRAIDD